MADTDTEREKGIEAIIFLQSVVGIDEPRERAERNWDAFSKHEKENTMMAYQVFKSVHGHG